MPLMSLVGNMGYVGVVVVGAQLALTGNATPGDIQSFIQYVRNFTQPVQQLGNVSNTMQSMAAATERVFEFPPRPRRSRRPTRRFPRSAPATWSLTMSSLATRPTRPSSTTLAARLSPAKPLPSSAPPAPARPRSLLLQRFYDVDGGSLRVEGVDVRDWDRAALRGEFAMVLQDTAV